MKKEFTPKQRETLIQKFVAAQNAAAPYKDFFSYLMNEYGVTQEDLEEGKWIVSSDLSGFEEPSKETKEKKN